MARIMLVNPPWYVFLGGSSPAPLGLISLAGSLKASGHEVVVFEKNPKVGGLLRYGIPDFKLSKAIIDRRMSQLQAEGVEFQTGNNLGYENLTAELRVYEHVVFSDKAQTRACCQAAFGDGCGIDADFEFYTDSGQ